MVRGFLYVATGDKYIKEAELSARSIRKCMPNACISIVTNQNFDSDIFEEIILVETNQAHNINWKQGLSYKVMGLKHTPYEKTVFIDTDTFFADNCEELFDILEYFDMTMCQAPNDTSKINIDNKKIEGYYPYNTGVIGYNKTQKVFNFLTEWCQLYKTKQNEYIGDQPAFMEALIFNNIKIYVLQPIYNFRFQLFVSLPPLKVKILHGRTSDYKRLEKIVNSKISHRVWSPYYRRVFSRFRRFKNSKKRLRSFLGDKYYTEFKKLIKY